MPVTGELVSRLQKMAGTGRDHPVPGKIEHLRSLHNHYASNLNSARREPTHVWASKSTSKLSLHLLIKGALQVSLAGWFRYPWLADCESYDTTDYPCHNISPIRTSWPRRSTSAQQQSSLRTCSGLVETIWYFIFKRKDIHHRNVGQCCASTLHHDFAKLQQLHLESWPAIKKCLAM